jgi:class 3 adenylate cyclase/tetratricopeptide (TPR) repeat protein
VICPGCGSDNRADRRYCLSCGGALGLSCSSCGAENEAEARFCGNCGKSLGASTSMGAREGSPGSVATGSPHAGQTNEPGRSAERRLVTVLFADLVGFTPFAEERDAEEVRATLERYSHLARETVSRYGGTIEKFIGDAVMAAWGTPVAHEDDAERAVRAALELVDLVDTLGSGIQARAGVLTGEAAVNLAATEQGFLAGDLVNSAARLQSVAPSGTVLVGESTMHAASAAVAFEPAGEQVLKGKQAAMPAWRAMRVVAQRRGAGRTESLETPFVGRDEEFRLLREQVHLSGRDPRARLVSITGPAGIGKSRLAWELEKYVDGVVEAIHWHNGRCPAYGEGISFWALGEMVRSRARLGEGDDEATTRQRISSVVEDYVSDPAERDWIAAALLVLLGVEQQMQGGRDSLFPAWRRFFESIAGRGTTVLVFEDLQWADDGLLDFLDHLLDWSRSLPLLVVTLARPELFDRRPGWGAGRRTLAALALDPLSDEHIAEMLSALVPDLPEQARRAIIERADGIPLYAVETLRMLLADGRLADADGRLQPIGELGSLEVPDSLRSLITSRLDGLPADDRRLLQDASVLGQSFTLPAISAISTAEPDGLEARLHQLIRRELLAVDADARSPERGQYRFMQSLIREVAYSTLARPERRARHLAAARYFEALGSDEIAGVLALHYSAAHRASPAGPEADAVAVQARMALRGAAERASSLGGHAQAAGFYEQALGVTSDAGDRAPLLERMAGELLRAARYSAAADSGREAMTAYASVGDTVGQARSVVVVGQAFIDDGRTADALEELARVGAAPEDELPAEVRCAVLAEEARAHYRNLDPVRALELAEIALAIAEHHDLRPLTAELLITKGTALQMLGRHYEPIALLREGIEMARRDGAARTALRGLANIGQVLATHSGATVASAATLEAIELARQVGDRSYELWLLSNASWAAIHSGRELGQPLADLEEVLSGEMALADRIRLTRHKLMFQYVLGASVDEGDERMVSEGLEDPLDRREQVIMEALGATASGDHSRAARLYEEAASLHQGQGWMLGLAIMSAASAGDLESAESWRRRLDSVDRGGPFGRGLLAAGEAALYAAQGRSGESMAAFRESTRLLRSLEHGFALGLALLVMADALGPDHPEAQAAGREALSIFERMGAEPLARRAREALRTSPDGPGVAARADLSEATPT